MDVMALMTENEVVLKEHLKQGRIRLMNEFDDKMLWAMLRDNPRIYVYTECGKDWVISQKQQQFFHNIADFIYIKKPIN